MNALPWVIIAAVVVLIVVGLVGAIVVFRKARKQATGEKDYRSLFVLGITFVLVGAAYGVVFWAADRTAFLWLGLAFVVMGIVYLVVGLSNRDKWGKTG